LFQFRRSRMPKKLAIRRCVPMASKCSGASGFAVYETGTSRGPSWPLVSPRAPERTRQRTGPLSGLDFQKEPAHPDSEKAAKASLLSRRSPASMCESFERRSKRFRFGGRGNCNEARFPSLSSGPKSILGREGCLRPPSISCLVAFRRWWCGLAIMGSSQIMYRGLILSRTCGWTNLSQAARRGSPLTFGFSLRLQCSLRVHGRKRGGGKRPSGCRCSAYSLAHALVRLRRYRLVT